jgi:branched-chain amino acid transport system permease protein
MSARAIMVAAGIVLIGGIPLIGSDYLIDLMTEIAIYALFALSLNVLVGYAGSVSFGHAAYFAIGGYSCAILLTTYEWPVYASLPAAVLFSAVCAGVIGFFCVRLTDIYFAMLTLAFSMLVWSVAFKWRSLTGGDDGFVGVTLPQLLTSRTVFYYFSQAVVWSSIAALWVICHSPFGRVLTAIRENPLRADFVGINTKFLRLCAFVVAGAFAGIAGGLFAMYNKGVYVESAFWTESAQVLIMVLLGGMYSFFGPALGALLLYLLDVLTNQYTEYWPAVLGTILLVVVLVAPDGLVGLVRRNRAGSDEDGG